MSAWLGLHLDSGGSVSGCQAVGKTALGVGREEELAGGVEGTKGRACVAAGVDRGLRTALWLWALWPALCGFSSECRFPNRRHRPHPPRHPHYRRRRCLKGLLWRQTPSLADARRQGRLQP